MGKIIAKVRAHNERVNKRLMEQAAIEARIEECRRRIESSMFGALRTHLHKEWDEGLARHMAGPVEGFAVPISAAEAPE